MDLKPIFSEDNDEYLEHYGVPGMKWGVRHDRERTGKQRRQVGEFKNGKYSVGTALRANYRMNSNDARRAQLQGSLHNESIRNAEIRQRMDRAKSKGKARSVQRLSKKLDKSNARVAGYKTERASLARDTNAIKKRIEKSGVAKVKTSQVRRTTMSDGEQAVAYLFMGNAAALYTNSKRNSTMGTGYRVTKKK